MKPWHSALLVASLVVLLGAWFLTRYDLEPRREWQPPRGVVWRDRFLACERFLARMGLRAEVLPALESARTLDRRTALIVPARRGAIAPATLEALRDYVARGGHLIMESERASGDDPLFDAFGVARAPIDQRATTRNGFEHLFSGPLADANRADDGGLVPARLDPDPAEEPLWVFFSGGEALSTAQPAALALGDEDNLRLVQFRLGAGWVTAVNDIEFAQNWQIGRNDNAEFLWRLLARSEGLEAVAILRGSQQSLAGWLLAHAGPVLGALAALLLVLLWRALPRLGPVLPDPGPTRRRLLDHLGASGQFLWSEGRRGTLAQAAARRAMSEAARQVPHLPLLPEAEQARLLEARFGLAPALARQLVQASFPDRQAPAMIQLARACALIHDQGVHDQGVHDQGVHPRGAQQPAAEARAEAATPN